MPQIKKVLYATTPLIVAAGFLVMLFSLKTSIFFKLIWIVLIPILPLSYRVFQITTITRCNPDFVYYRREKPTTADARPPDRPPATSSITPRILRRSSKTSRSPEHYGFTHTSLMTTLSSLSIPSSYLHAQYDN
eukprot:TRINITY_DN18073_c1_g1_i1.p1 TRINITY_DN18073_c1_g1~~TRINITY_DN18073_c1_g1_i1.p1  ORF type:complete len:134 (+),score=8.43 TRINITY_DN18073_c1_g1_i1:171-572(+)